MQQKAAEWLDSLSGTATEVWMAVLKAAATVALMDGDWVDNWVALTDDAPLAAQMAQTTAVAKAVPSAAGTASQRAANWDMLSAETAAGQTVGMTVYPMAAATETSWALHLACGLVETLGCAMARHWAPWQVALTVQAMARTTAACSAGQSETHSGSMWEQKAAEWLDSLSGTATEVWMAVLKVAATVALMDGDWVDNWVALTDDAPLAAQMAQTTAVAKAVPSAAGTACQRAANWDMLSAETAAEQTVGMTVYPMAAATETSWALHLACGLVETLGCAMARRWAPWQVALTVQGMARTTAACSAGQSETHSGAMWEQKAAEWLDSLSGTATEVWMAVLKVAATVAPMAAASKSLLALRLANR